MTVITDPWFYALAVPAVLITGISKTGLGSGSGGIAVPLMSQVIAPGAAAGIMLPILCVMDVLGLRGTRTHLIGEARWQQQPLDSRDLEALRRKVSRVPRPVDTPVYALWGRGGVAPEVRAAGALGFSIEDVLQP